MICFEYMHYISGYVNNTQINEIISRQIITTIRLSAFLNFNSFRGNCN